MQRCEKKTNPATDRVERAERVTLSAETIVYDRLIAVPKLRRFRSGSTHHCVDMLRANLTHRYLLPHFRT